MFLQKLGTGGTRTHQGEAGSRHSFALRDDQHKYFFTHIMIQGHVVFNTASFFRHFEKNSRTKKLKTQEKNSITQGKNSRFGQALKKLSL